MRHALSFLVATALVLATSLAAADEPAPVPPTIIETAPAPPPASPPPPAGPTIRVHVSSPKTVALQRREDDGWKDACLSPCDRELPIDGTYRVVGEGLDQGVTLAPREGGVFSIDVTLPSQARATIGGFTVGTAAIGLLFGLTWIVRGTDHTHLDCDHPPPGDYETKPDCDASKRFAPTERTIGIVSMGVSAVVAAVGSYLLVNATTSGIKEASPSAPPPRDAFLRLPTWRGPSREASAPPASFPVLLEGVF